MSKRENNGVTIYDIRELVKAAAQCKVEIKLAGIPYWVPARSLGWNDIRTRLKAVWMVWTGKADIVTWPGQ